LAARRLTYRIDSAARFTLWAVAGFALAAVSVHGLREEYVWSQAPLSFYLSGAYGALLQAAYLGLAFAVAMLGVAMRDHVLCTRNEVTCAVLSWPQRIALISVPLLCTSGALSLVLTAMYPGGTPMMRVPADEYLLHKLAAMTSFSCLGIVMALQGWLWWGCRQRGGFARWALPLGVLCVLGFISLVLWREAPRGALQKLVIALYLLWLTCAAAWMRRSPSSDSVGSVDSC
jgi:hypothetical protein